MTDAEGPSTARSVEAEQPLVLLDEWDVALRGPNGLAEEKLRLVLATTEAVLRAWLLDLESRLTAAAEVPLRLELRGE